MSLVLPYPSLSFVPLDVLTAEEMNQIVANYSFIANQFPLATANIADGAVTSDKIDWTTMRYGSTSEDLIVGEFDGKPVYRHVERFLITSEGWVTTKLTNPIQNLDEIINAFGSVFNQDRNIWLQISRVRPTNPTFGFGLGQITDSSVAFDIGADVIGPKKILLFVDYTK